MERNIGTTDKIVRVIIGAALLVGAYLSSGWLVWVLAILGVILIATAFVGFCGLYTIMGWNTCPVNATVLKNQQAGPGTSKTAPKARRKK